MELLFLWFHCSAPQYNITLINCYIPSKSLRSKNSKFFLIFLSSILNGGIEPLLMQGLYCGMLSLEIFVIAEHLKCFINNLKMYLFNSAHNLLLSFLYVLSYFCSFFYNADAFMWSLCVCFTSAPQAFAFKRIWHLTNLIYYYYSYCLWYISGFNWVIRNLLQ